MAHLIDLSTRSGDAPFKRAGYSGRLPTAELCFSAISMTRNRTQEQVPIRVSVPKETFRSILLSLLLGTAAICLLSLSVSAQVESTSDRQLDLKSVRQTRNEIEDNAALEATLKEHLLGLYDQAISDLQAEVQSRVQIQQYGRDQEGIQAEISALEEELERVSQEEPPELSESTSAERTENLLTQELAGLASLRVALRDAVELSEERLTRRTEIARSLGSLSQQLESLSDELRSAAQSSASEELKDALRTRLFAQRQALRLGQA